MSTDSAILSSRESHRESHAPVLTLAQLDHMAAAFDRISDETGARYSAAAFAEYVRDELKAQSNRSMTREHQRVGARRRQTELEIVPV